ncbi:MAG: rRNA maturation RNase YbeY [Roseobacter sp.]|jgi:probable rRNA maturation factor
MDIDVLMEDARWREVGLEHLVQAAVAATVEFLALDPSAIEISVLACDDARIAALNRDHRGKPVPTNVLSWPAEDLRDEDEGMTPVDPTPDPDGSLALGDLALAYETCLREAEEQGKTPSDHVIHLIVHGTLHLLGYDHMRVRDAALMEGIERKILGKMGIDDPYRE